MLYAEYEFPKLVRNYVPYYNNEFMTADSYCAHEDDLQDMIIALQGRQNGIPPFVDNNETLHEALVSSYHVVHSCNFTTLCLCYVII